MARAEKLLREQLDRKLQIAAKSGVSIPSKGWVRALREALGMSQTQLAERLGMARQNLNRLEKAEVSGNIELKTLQKVAAALGCDFRYVLLPKTSLEDMVRKQARALAQKIVLSTEKHMELESQETSKRFQKQRIEELSEELARQGGKKIWRTR